MTRSRLISAGNSLIALATMLLLVPSGGPAQTATDDSTVDGVASESANGRDTQDTLDSSIRDALAPMIVSGVEHIRDEALAAPNHAVSPDVRDAFKGYVSERLLNKVRWRVEDADLSLQRAVFVLRDTRALTADYVIVFANAEDVSSLLLWAHELHHVVQYDAWGIEGFVTRYLADYESIEHEANEFVWRWRDATR